MRQEMRSGRGDLGFGAFGAIRAAHCAIRGLHGLKRRAIRVWLLAKSQPLTAIVPRQNSFGEKSYAIVSGKYLNFSSRVGYHYCVVDAYCGKTENKNYITFSFKGGAADETRRNRRVRAIARILTAMDFSVEVKADRVDALFRKRDAPATVQRLEAIGRLLNFTRQMDMLMVSESSVEAITRSFLEGNYRLEANRKPPSPTPGSAVE